MPAAARHRTKWVVLALGILAVSAELQAQTTIYRFKRADSGCTRPCSGVLRAIDPDRPAVLWSAPIPATSTPAWARP